MSFLKNLFSGQRFDGSALVESQDLKEYAQVDLLAQFDPPQALHEPKEQARWSRVLPRSYSDEIALFQKQGWLAQQADGTYGVTAAGQPFVDSWRRRLLVEKDTAMAKAREALATREKAKRSRCGASMRIACRWARPSGRGQSRSQATARSRARFLSRTSDMWTG